MAIAESQLQLRQFPKTLKILQSVRIIFLLRFCETFFNLVNDGCEVLGGNLPVGDPSEKINAPVVVVFDQGRSVIVGNKLPRVSFVPKFYVQVKTVFIIKARFDCAYHRGAVNSDGFDDDCLWLAVDGFHLLLLVDCLGFAIKENKRDNPQIMSSGQVDGIITNSPGGTGKEKGKEDNKQPLHFFPSIVVNHLMPL